MTSLLKTTTNPTTRLLLHANTIVVFGLWLILCIDDKTVLTFTSWITFICALSNFILLKQQTATVFVKIYLLALLLLIQPFVALPMSIGLIKVLHLAYGYFHIMIMVIYVWINSGKK